MPLAEGQVVDLSQGQAHYLGAVMRRTIGDAVAIFNGAEGEWTAEIVDLAKRRCRLRCRELVRKQTTPCDLWLLFAPLKKTRTDFVVEKAVELGVSKIMPVLTRFTNAERLRPDRLRSIAVEAAEQCRALDVPEISDLKRLDAILKDWPSDRALVFADEAAIGQGSGQLPQTPAAVLIGPEGGFAEEERKVIREIEAAWPISLGPRILRAETAAVSALTLFQAQSGDWR